MTEEAPKARRPRALLVENIHQDAAHLLNERGFDVELLQPALSESELLAHLDGVSVLGIRSKTQVTAKVLAEAKDLLAIGAFCIGTDQVDLGTAAAQGVPVFNAPYSNTRSVVELALGEIIALTRRLTEKNERLHAGVWDKSATGAHEIRGRTLGIIGYGNIGSQLSVVAEALGMHVVFFDTADRLALGNAQRRSSMNAVLEEADVVSLHVDGRKSNRLLFGEEQFARMRDGALFLNLCRGFVIDHEALSRHLESGHLSGAAVDVFLDEPASRDQEFKSVLRGAPNVILTPHIGGSTEEAQADIGHFVSGKLAEYVAEGSTNLSVNLPQLLPPHKEGERRFAHLHKNIPGVMAEINSVFANRGVNVEGQFLSTSGELGYALTDVSADVSEDVVTELGALGATVRLRVLG